VNFEIRVLDHCWEQADNEAIEIFEQDLQTRLNEGWVIIDIATLIDCFDEEDERLTFVHRIVTLQRDVTVIAAIGE
jgi:hypothetical protein